MSSWHSYPSAFNLGHRAVRDLLTVPHYVEEKVDGSQFSFGLFPCEHGDGPDIVDSMTAEVFELKIRSKGAVMITDAPEKMFSLAADTVKRLAPQLHPGWTYRGEYLRVPKHNTLAYDRVPAGNVILFDVSTGEEEWLGPDEKFAEAQRLGLECVNVLWAWTGEGERTTLEDLRKIIDHTTSALGGQKIEGIVVKQLGPDFLYGQDRKTLIGKFVSERFKEAHVGAWKASNPTSGDILLNLGQKYCTQARWMKAIQHLREAGQITDSPKDIGPLMIEIQKDMGKEEKEAIQRDLWKWAQPHITRAATAGFPEFYKLELLRRQFEGGADERPAGDPVPSSDGGGGVLEG